MSFSVRSYLKDHVLLFDGAMGTLFQGRVRRAAAGCEEANLTDPDEILSIHREYIASGARAIKTNTFAVNPVNYPNAASMERLLYAGYHLALDAAGDSAAVFCDIGPVNPLQAEDTADAIMQVADVFLKLGAENFLFETQSDPSGLEEVCSHIRAARQNAFILISFAVMPDGFSRDGIHIRDLVKAVPSADAIGLNCVSTPVHMQELLKFLPRDGRPVSVMPNAGYPGVAGTHTFYEARPRVFAERVASMASEGASIVGGCCGTTPEFIAALAPLIDGIVPSGLGAAPADAGEASAAAMQDNALLERIKSGKRVICVELDPPKNADLAPFMNGARVLMDAGIDAMTIADCPIGRARADSSLLACKVKRELGLDVIPHLTCRDRNVNATRALLYGLYGEGIRNVLAVTGDPIPTAERDEVKSVYQFNSRKLARFITSLGENDLPGPFTVFGALNINAVRFDVQLSLARQKMENGMKGFLTQPVLSRQGLENLKLAREQLPDAILLGGIIPPVSKKNARFMDAEVRGISVDPDIIERFVGLDRAQGEALGLEIALDAAKRIAPYVDGYYLITPFSRTAMMAKLIAAIREIPAEAKYAADVQ